MKLAELKSYKVISHHDKKKHFSGTREQCVDFINLHDKAKDEYVDLRIIKPDGKEDKYWETKPSLQHKYKGL